jgi:hypothetical protein
MVSTMVSQVVVRPPLCSTIVPLFLSSKEVPQEEVLVYAMLDSRDTTFVAEEVVEAIQSSSQPATLKIVTMTETTEERCQRHIDLRIRGMDSEEFVELPPTYTRTSIPMNRSQIPTPQVASAWPHLEQVARRIQPLQPCGVGLLVGFDCPAALAPLEVVVGNSPKDPYAQRTALGWTIVGRISTAEYKDTSMSVTHRTRAKDVTTQEMIKALEGDFRDASDDTSNAYSQEDLRFLKILEEGTYFDEEGFIQMPLPFKKDQPNLPCNRSMAEKRWEYLQAKFQKVPSLLEESKLRWT